MSAGADPEILLLQVVHHGIHARRQHSPVVLIVGIGLIDGSLSLTTHPLHVLLVLFLDVLHPDVVYPVKQSHLHVANQHHQVHRLKLESQTATWAYWSCMILELITCRADSVIAFHVGAERSFSAEPQKHFMLTIALR